MLNFFKFKRFLKKPRKIEDQIRVFLKWRRSRNMTTYVYVEWLGVFVKYLEKIEQSEDYNAWDIDSKDILLFLEYVRENVSVTQFSAQEAEKVLNVIRRFYTARTNNLEGLAEYRDEKYSRGVSYLADIKRNREIVQTYLKDRALPPKMRKWSYRKLADRYGLTFPRIQQIVKRDSEKYGKAYGMTASR